jgi:hypothetical protein
VAANVQENAEDIYAGAQQINEERALADAEIDGAEEKTTEVFEDEQA